MIICNILGGLGNQLFQFATGLATARATEQDLRFSVDGFASYSLHHGLQLEECFELSLERASSADLRAILGLWRSPARMRRLLSRLPPLRGSGFVGEPSTEWWPELRTQSRHGAYLHGYWQSERYFEDQIPAVREALRWRHALSGRNAAVAQEIMNSKNSVSLHVRRGDYVSSASNQALYATCSPDYYLAAIERLRLVTGQETMKVFAFSDDQAWVRETLSPRIPNLTLIEHNRGADSWLDMHLMSLCRHHVIANSSFSWWGAWLDNRSESQVVAPQRWYANGLPDADLVPNRWHRL